MTVGVVASVLLLLVILSSVYSVRTNGEFSIEVVKMGYCPTMSLFAEEIASNNGNVVLIEGANAAEVLKDLSKGKINLALIGRMAKNFEAKGAEHLFLGEGYTLVGNKKRLVTMQELAESRVHTYVDEKLVRKLVPNSQIIFYNNIEDAIEAGISEVVLIDWKEFSDEHELVIPVYSDGRKVEHFRMPVLYSYGVEMINDLDV